ncbi:hypothetical protein SprV_0100188400 [Sparganum proliferum]
MVNFYRRPLPNCADLMLPLTNMLSNIKALLELTGDPLTAFEGIKASLTDATSLRHPALEAQLSLTADALIVANRGCFRSNSDKYNARKIAHLDLISQFPADILHIDGTKNEVADMLYRPSHSALRLSHATDLDTMEAEQQRLGCPDDEFVRGLQLTEVSLTIGIGTIFL